MNRTNRIFFYLMNQIKPELQKNKDKERAEIRVAHNPISLLDYMVQAIKKMNIPKKSNSMANILTISQLFDNI